MGLIFWLQYAVLDKESRLPLSTVESCGAIRKEWWEMPEQASPDRASAAQAKQVISLVDKFSHDQVQNLITNGDLLKIMMGADLARVDRKAFVDVVVPEFSVPSGWFTHVDQLVDRIAVRPKSEGFTRKQLDGLRRALYGHDHAGKYQPVTVDLWYGTLPDTRDATIRWFADECRNLGLNPYDYLSAVKLGFYPGSEYRGGRKLAPAGLDLLAYFDPKDGIVPNRILTPSERWPGFVVLQTLNLNPQLIPKLGTDEFPPYGLMMPGLVADDGGVPFVDRSERYAYVYCSWASSTWDYTALPRDRELQQN